MVTRKCIVCGGLVFTKGASVICSKKCRIENRLLNSQKNISKKPCLICKTIFQPIVVGAKYCSNECRETVYYNRREKIKYYYIFKRDHFICVYCGKSSIEDGVKLQLEHVVPVSKGGKTTIDNLVTSCSICNQLKHNEPLIYEIVNRIKKEIGLRNKGVSEFLFKQIVNELERVCFYNKHREGKYK